MSTAAPAADTRVYRGPSVLVEGHLALATSAPDRADDPAFFAGFVRRPRVVAAGLMALADLAGCDFRQASAASGGSGGRDPVVTGDGERLRFEALSRCGGVYGRLDLGPDELDGAPVGRGTTNVDVNPPLYQALSRVGAADPLRLSVGPDELAVATLDGRVVEKKVPLPERWLRGLAEVAARALPLDPRLELPAGRASALLAEISGRAVRQTRWLLPAGSAWRPVVRPARGAVCVADGFRLAALRPLLPLARTLTAYAPPADGTAAQASGWVLDFGAARFTLLLSAATNHGFAGDGRLLTALAGNRAGAGAETAGAPPAHAETAGTPPAHAETAGTLLADAETVGALLAAEPVAGRASIVARTGWTPDRVTSAVAALATAGQVGYDVAEATSFHRPLPYRADLVAALHPRLAAARLLADAGRVVPTGAGFEVRSGAHTYLVHRRGDDWGCTCAWWGEHRGRRGPCKHVVATVLTIGSGSGE